MILVKSVLSGSVSRYLCKEGDTFTIHSNALSEVGGSRTESRRQTSRSLRELFVGEDKQFREEVNGVQLGIDVIYSRESEVDSLTIRS